MDAAQATTRTIGRSGAVRAIQHSTPESFISSVLSGPSNLQGESLSFDFSHRRKQFLRLAVRRWSDARGGVKKNCNKALRTMYENLILALKLCSLWYVKVNSQRVVE